MPNGVSVPSYSFLEVLTVYEEQFFVSRGCPLEDAATLCNSLRREGRMEEFMCETERFHTHHCTCGGAGNCQDCSNRQDRG